MQAQLDFNAFLVDCVAQLDVRLKDFKIKAEANKKKKGSAKSDSSRRSAEQVEDHKKMIQRLIKIVQKDAQFEPTHVAVFSPRASSAESFATT